MKLPAVAIAVAFAAGILPGVRGFDSRHAGAHRFLEVLLIGIGLGLALGFFLAFSRYLRPATLLSLEYSILEENDPTAVHADVLKVGHHGSKNSTMPERGFAANCHHFCGRRESLCSSEPRISSAACISFAQTRKAPCKCGPMVTI